MSQASVLVMIGIILLIFLIPSLVAYILGALGLMKIADRSDIKYGWLAWFPFGGNYVLGRIAWDQTIALVFTGISFIMVSSAFWGDLGFISSVAYGALSIFNFITIHKIYKKMSDKAVVMTVFTVLTCGFMAGIFLFAIRKNPMITDNSASE